MGTAPDIEPIKSPACTNGMLSIGFTIGYERHWRTSWDTTGCIMWTVRPLLHAVKCWFFSKLIVVWHLRCTCMSHHIVFGTAPGCLLHHQSSSKEFTVARKRGQSFFCFTALMQYLKEGAALSKQSEAVLIRLERCGDGFCRFCAVE